MIGQIIFLIGLLFCFTPLVSPPLALALGLIIAFTVGHPFKKFNGIVIKHFLQASVVALGFGLNFGEVFNAGKSGVCFTVFSITGTLFAGYLIGKWLVINQKTSYLISCGTAICGGSAIAAIAPIIEAGENEVAVALGTIFILNAIALFLFPPLGHYFGLTVRQFGMWAAIAIHDTSSVVGAATRYGDEALKLATTVKLTRALWIIPVCLVTAIILKNKSTKISFPYFIFGFIGASLIVTFLPVFKPVYNGIMCLGKIGLTVTLFLIGTGLSPNTLRVVGIKPVVQGVILWVLVSIVSLSAVRSILF